MTSIEIPHFAVRDTLTGVIYPQPNKTIAERVAEWHGHSEVIAFTPPADDVREALAFHLFAEESTQDEEFTRRVWENHPDEHPVKRLYFDQADAIRSVFEVRPRGTVTNAEVRAVQDTVAPEFHGLSYRERLIARRVLEAAAEARRA